MNKDAINATDEQVATEINLDNLRNGRTLDQYGEVGNTRYLLRQNLCNVACMTVEDAIGMSQDGYDLLPEDEEIIRGDVIQLLEKGDDVRKIGYIGGDLRRFTRFVSKNVGRNMDTSISA